MSNNVVHIGTALKWRGEYEQNKKYYNENIVTAFGCVFRCKILQTIGQSPISFEEETGYLTYINKDIWDVVVDNAHYYNISLDTDRLLRQTLDHVKKIDEDIVEIHKVDNKQWDKINKLKKVNKKQSKQINHLKEGFNEFVQFTKGNFDSIQEHQERQDEQLNQHQTIIENLIGDFTPSVVNNGIWKNNLKWTNEDLWWNYNHVNSGNNGDNCECGPVLSDLNKTVKDLTSKITEQQGQIDDLKKLIQQLLSGEVYVVSYDEIKRLIELGGKIFVDFHNELTEELSLSLPNSEILYDKDSQGIEIH